ncbi:hypothetical protein M5K25_007526 [Dendrobium thyrsiflorum]|uniref:Uncharacterized protein n=1 Tax=Dendrobium thyrsiflorum TaxID=117978 RepID=A0ABD0VFF0_DENTH
MVECPSKDEQSSRVNMRNVQVAVQRFLQFSLLSCRPGNCRLLSGSSSTLKYVVPSCMENPELDHGFVYNDQGQVDILKSPFFEVNLEIDRTVEEYIDKIIFSLAAAINVQLSPFQWQIVSKS